MLYSPAVSSDIDEYGSFDEEELELLNDNDLLQPHPLQLQLAASDHPEKICSPSPSITGQSVAQLFSVEDSEGQPGDAKEVPDFPHVEEAGEGRFQVPGVQVETVTDEIMFEVQYTGIDKSVRAGIFCYLSSD